MSSISEVLIGHSLTIECNSTSETVWYSEYRNHTYMSILNSYQITSVSLDTNRDYYCYGQHYTSTQAFLAKVKVKFYGKFAVTK